eukprot:Tamp_16040.p1 GENE.Tamp_16040~~Tamp_16040.p1  ORF type:complete len:475 (+),score=83.61 Tamp_16040:80-1426(+)
MPFGLKKAPDSDAQIRLFNLDLHYAVIADVKDTLKTLYGPKVHVTCWSQNMMDITGFGFDKPDKTMFQQIGEEKQNTLTGGRTTVNLFSWYDLTEQLVDAFCWVHNHTLSKYDGFVVTHSPVFCRLFEKFEKPIILVNTCRYDQPYCWSGDYEQLAELNACLNRLQSKGLLVAISNNKADQDYLRLGSGVESVHLPSLSKYTNTTYDAKAASNVPALIASMQFSIPAEQKAQLEAKGIMQKQGRLEWEALYQRRALIHFPYEVSTMSVFEQYSAGVPLLFPTKRFCHELMSNHDRSSAIGSATTSSQDAVAALHLVSRFWQGAYCPLVLVKPLENADEALQGVCAKHAHILTEDRKLLLSNPDRVVPEVLKATLEIGWWLDRADFYDTEWFPGIRHFDSWDQLIEMATCEASVDASREHCAWLEQRRKRILDCWQNLVEDKFPVLKEQ